LDTPSGTLYGRRNKFWDFVRGGTNDFEKKELSSGVWCSVTTLAGFTKEVDVQSSTVVDFGSPF